MSRALWCWAAVFSVGVLGCERPISSARRPCLGGGPGAIEIAGNVSEKVTVLEPVAGQNRDRVGTKRKPVPPVVYHRRPAERRTMVADGDVYYLGCDPKVVGTPNARPFAGRHSVNASVVMVCGVRASGEFPESVVADRIVMRDFSIAIPTPRVPQPIAIEANDLVLEGRSSITTLGRPTHDPKVHASSLKLTVHNGVRGDGRLTVTSRGLDCPR